MDTVLAVASAPSCVRRGEKREEARFVQAAGTGRNRNKAARVPAVGRVVVAVRCCVCVRKT